MTEETKDVDGVHPANNLEVANFHFNVIKIVRDAKQEFETKNPGKTAAFFYAPEPFLYLVDRAVKSQALVTGSVPDEVLNASTVTHIFGLELISILGTCFTVTAEAVHDDQPEEQHTEPVAQIIPRDQTPN